MFDMQITLCERFPAMTPFSIRKERAVDVFKLIVKYSKHSQRQKKKPEKQKIIRRPAQDTWW